MSGKTAVVEKATECAACGGPLGEERYGRYDDFCSVKCRKAGRGFCKLCGKSVNDPPTQSTRSGRRYTKDFCGNICKSRFYSRGNVSPSLIEEMHRLTCKACGEPLLPPKKGTIKIFCSNSCRIRYKRTSEQGLGILERWGSFAPETRRILQEIERDLSPGTAKRMATAIDREYAPRRKSIPVSIPQSNRAYGKTVKYICKGCGKEFGRIELSPLSKDYCTNLCELKAEGYKGYYGERNAYAKFTWEQIDEIRSLHASGRASFLTLAEKYHVGASTIAHIVHYDTWKPENDPRQQGQGHGLVTVARRSGELAVGENNPSAKLTWKEVDEIRHLSSTKQLSQNEIAEKYGVSQSAIQRITSYGSWKPENDPRRKEMQS